MRVINSLAVTECFTVSEQSCFLEYITIVLFTLEINCNDLQCY